jgi:hypothetical protein
LQRTADIGKRLAGSRAARDRMTLDRRPEIEYLDGRAHPKVSPRLSHGQVQDAIFAGLD